jgi:hypothetical protein
MQMANGPAPTGTDMAEWVDICQYVARYSQICALEGGPETQITRTRTRTRQNPPLYELNDAPPRGCQARAGAGCWCSGACCTLHVQGAAAYAVRGPRKRQPRDGSCRCISGPPQPALRPLLLLVVVVLLLSCNSSYILFHTYPFCSLEVLDTANALTRWHGHRPPSSLHPYVLERTKKRRSAHKEPALQVSTQAAIARLLVDNCLLLRDRLPAPASEQRAELLPQESWSSGFPSRSRRGKCEPRTHCTRLPPASPPR